MLGDLVLGGYHCDPQDRGWYVTPLSSVRYENEPSRYMAKRDAERTKVVKAMASTLQRTAMNIVTIVNKDKEHIPPITTSETNPFPYQIELNPRLEGWGKSIGIF